MGVVLIAEDEPRISAFVRKGLAANGIEARVLTDGYSAYTYARSADIDLLVLDTRLPTMDGYEVLRRLRAEGRSLPVVMMVPRTGVANSLAKIKGKADARTSSSRSASNSCWPACRSCWPSREPRSPPCCHTRRASARSAHAARPRRCLLGGSVVARMCAGGDLPAAPRPDPVEGGAAASGVGRRQHRQFERRRRVRDLPATQTGRSPVHLAPGTRLPARGRPVLTEGPPAAE